MTEEIIHIDGLLPYLFATFEGDDELVAYFDPGCQVTDWQSCCTAIYRKIKENYPTATIKAVKDIYTPVGYYVVEKDMLISFGLHRSHRNKNNLKKFWKLITSEFDGPFSCVLYSINSRAIGWLKKSGMKLLFDHVSILQSCPQEE
jgi:hypothetical protein